MPGRAGEENRTSKRNAEYDSRRISLLTAQDNNVVVKTWGTPREEPELLNHVDLVAKLGIADLDKGAAVAGLHSII